MLLIPNPLFISIIHLSYFPLCSLRSLWLNHSDFNHNIKGHGTAVSLLEINQVSDYLMNSIS